MEKLLTSAANRSIFGDFVKLRYIGQRRLSVSTNIAAELVWLKFL